MSLVTHIRTTPTQETTVHLNHTSELATLEHGHSTQRVGPSSAVRDCSQSPFDELHCPVVQLLEVVRGVGHFVRLVSCEGSDAEILSMHTHTKECMDHS